MVNPTSVLVVKYLKEYLTGRLREIFLPIITENDYIASLFEHDFWLKTKAKKQKIWALLLRDLIIEQVDNHVAFVTEQAKMTIEACGNMRRWKNQKEEFFKRAAEHIQENKSRQMCSSIIRDAVDNLSQAMHLKYNSEKNAVSGKKARASRASFIEANSTILEQQAEFSEWITSFIAVTVEQNIHGNITEVINNSIKPRQIQSQIHKRRHRVATEAVSKLYGNYGLIEQASAAFKTSIVVYSENCIQVKAFDEGTYTKKLIIESFNEDWRVVSDLESNFLPLETTLAMEFGVSVNEFLARCKKHKNGVEEHIRQLNIIRALMTWHCISKHSVKVIYNTMRSKAKAETKYLDRFNELVKTNKMPVSKNEEEQQIKKSGSTLLFEKDIRTIQLEIENSRRRKDPAEQAEEAQMKD